MAFTLFLISPVYAILVRDWLWPRTLDLWARRSRSNLQGRLTTLEGILLDAEAVRRHTEFEERIFWALHGIILMASVGTQSIIGMAFGLFAVLRANSPTRGEPIQWMFEIGTLYFFVMNVLAVVVLSKKFERYRKPRSERWRKARREEISRLRSQLSELR